MSQTRNRLSLLKRDPQLLKTTNLLLELLVLPLGLRTLLEQQTRQLIATILIQTPTRIPIQEMAPRAMVALSLQICRLILINPYLQSP